jgi:hypothetical protein
VEPGEGADSAAGGTCEILGVEEAYPDSVAMEDDELERVGLAARPPEGVGKDGFDVVDGDGLERGTEEEMVVGAGPG